MAVSVVTGDVLVPCLCRFDATMQRTCLSDLEDRLAKFDSQHEECSMITVSCPSSKTVHVTVQESSPFALWLRCLSCSGCIRFVLEVFARTCQSIGVANIVLQSLFMQETPEKVALLSRCTTLPSILEVADPVADVVLESCKHNNIFLANYTLLLLCSYYQSMQSKSSSGSCAQADFSYVIRQRRLLERAICTLNYSAMNWLMWNNANCVSLYPIASGLSSVPASSGTPVIELLEFRNPLILAVEVFSFATSRLAPIASVVAFDEKNALETLTLMLRHPKLGTEKKLTATKNLLIDVLRCYWDHAPHHRLVPLIESCLKTYRLFVIAITTVGVRLPSSFFHVSFPEVLPASLAQSGSHAQKSALIDLLSQLKGVDSFGIHFHRETNLWKLFRHVMSYKSEVTVSSELGVERVDLDLFRTVSSLYSTIGGRLLMNIYRLQRDVTITVSVCESLYRTLLQCPTNEEKHALASDLYFSSLKDIVDRIDSPLTHDV